MKFDIIKRNISWLILDRVFKAVIGFVTLTLLARYLGAEEYGKYSLIISILSVCSAISALGMKDSLIHRFLEQKDGIDAVVYSAMVIRIAMSSVIFLLANLIMPLLRSNDNSFYLIFLIMSGVLFFQFNEVGKYYFEANIKYKSIVIIENFTLAAFLIIKAILIYEDCTIFSIAIAHVLEAIIQSILILIVFKRSINFSVANKLNIGLALSLIKESLPLLISSLIIIITIHIDRIVYGYLMGDYYLGIFSVGSQLFIFAMSFISAAEISLYPNFIKNKNKQLDMVKEIGRFYYLINCIQIVILIISLLCSDRLIEIIFGGEYKSAATTLNSFLAANIFITFARAFDQYFRVMKKFKYLFIRQLTILIIHFPLMVLLIPEIGVYAPAVSSAISYVIVCLLTVVYGEDKREIRKLYKYSIGINT